jgi:cytoskeletal protein RodZ
MENKKSNSHLGESLRRKLENFPEEFPSENDWQQVRSRLMNEGLQRKKSNRKRYLLLLLLLLIVGISGLVTIPFLSKKQNVNHTEIAPVGTKATETNNVQQNNIHQEKALTKDKTKPIYEKSKQEKCSR